MFPIFINNILPIFLIGGAGFALGKKFQVQPRLLSQVTLYLFSPCLAFKLLTTQRIDFSEAVGLFGFVFLISLAIALVAYGLGWLLKLERRLMAAVLMCAIFMNAGNFGIPLLGFSFGEKAQAYGALYFVCMVAITNTIGIAIASSGTMAVSKAVLNLFRFPMLYAVILAGVVMALDWQLPVPVTRSIEILSGAAIPCMIVLLGLQLQTAQWKAQYSALGLALVARMIVAPALALGLANGLGWQGDLLRAAVIESAMPPAVMNSLIAAEFKTEPSFVTFVVLAGTLISPLTLTPLLAFLGA